MKRLKLIGRPKRLLKKLRLIRLKLIKFKLRPRRLKTRLRQIKKRKLTLQPLPLLQLRTKRHLPEDYKKKRKTLDLKKRRESTRDNHSFQLWKLEKCIFAVFTSLLLP
jgi:hypothetical protein